MSYYSKNCMVSKEEAEQIRRNETKRIKNFSELNKKAIRFIRKYKEVIVKHLSENEKEP